MKFIETPLFLFIGVFGTFALIVSTIGSVVKGFNPENLNFIAGSIFFTFLGFGGLWANRHKKNKEIKLFHDGMHIDEVSEILGADFVLENIQIMNESEGIKEYLFTSQKNSSSLRRFETQNDRITKVY